MDVVVWSELPGIAEHLASLHEHHPRSTAACRHPIRVEIRSNARAGFWRARFSVWGDGEEIFADCRSREVLPCADWAINHRVAARCTEYLQLHAATMARCGRGFVFAGRSGSGKSTLAAALLARGWEFLSDEFLLLDPRTLLAHPFPKALCLKAGSFPLIRRLGLPLWTNRWCEKGAKGRVGYIPAFCAFRGRELVPRPIGVVCLVSHVAGSNPHLGPISPAEAAFELSRCVFNRDVHGTETTSMIAEVVRSAACFRLSSGLPDATCDLLESLPFGG